MKKRQKTAKNDRVGIVWGLVLLIGLQLPAHALTVKLGSLAPAGTPWDKSLKQISAEWASLSGGNVKMKIYPGGIAGDEPDMLRKMRLGQLQAAGVTSVSLWSIVPGLLAMHLPLLIRSDEELEYVLDKMKPMFEQDLEQKGFKVLVWSTVGWASFFSRKPVVTPFDLQKQKLFIWEGNSDEVQSWKEIGFKPVPLAATDIMASLQSGMIDALVTTPINAASNQWFGIAKNMCSLKWAPLLGAIVISTKTWKRVKPGLRTKLLDACVRIGREMQAEVKKTDAQAVKVMQENGLVIHQVPPAVRRQWKDVVKDGFQTFAGKGYDKKYYDTIVKYLEEFRSR